MQEEEVKACEQCSQVPENYLSLDCNHCFCLGCIAKQFINGGRVYRLEGEANMHYICQLCEKDTLLDECSEIAIDGVIKEIVLPMLKKLQQSGTEEASPPPLSVPQTPTRQQTKCEIHQKEEVSLFCFTCEHKCFCIKCMLKHDNKTHEICNVSSCLKRLKSKMNDATHTIAASLELMQLQLKRLLDQESTQQEELDYMANRVSQQFRILYETLQSKEQEILQQLGNVKELQSQQSERIAGEIQMKINSLVGLKSDFENIGLSEQLVPSVSLLNYYSECKQIMQKVIGQMSFSDIFSQQVKYFPENGISPSYLDIFFKADEFEGRVQTLKLQIERLLAQPAVRSISQHEKYQSRLQPNIVEESYQTQRFHTQMDESTDSFKSHQVSVYSKVHTPISNQRTIQQKLEEIKNLHSERMRTQQKMSRQTEHISESQVQRSFSELASFKKQTALGALRVQQGMFDSRVTKKQK